MRIFASIAALLGAFAVIGLLVNRTSELLSGVGRLIVAILMGLAIAWMGIGYFRQLGHPPPPDPVPTQVNPDLKLFYMCEMCGMELAVVKIAKEKAPKHCGEAMILMRD